MSFEAQVETTVPFKMEGHHLADIECTVFAIPSGNEPWVTDIWVTDLDGQTLKLDYDCKHNESAHGRMFRALSSELGVCSHFKSEFWEQYQIYREHHEIQAA